MSEPVEHASEPNEVPKKARLTSAEYARRYREKNKDRMKEKYRTQNQVAAERFAAKVADEFERITNEDGTVAFFVCIKCTGTLKTLSQTVYLNHLRSKKHQVVALLREQQSALDPEKKML